MKKTIIILIMCILLTITTTSAVISQNKNQPPQQSARADWTQIQKLFEFNCDSSDAFGTSLAVDGNTALIGSTGDDDVVENSGSVYVYVWSGTTWTRQTKLLASDAEQYDQFGVSVAIDGDIALIGASYKDDQGSYSGAAYVFTRTGTTWTQQTKLLSTDGDSEDYFGCDVALEGDTALIGAYGDDYSRGAAYIFTRTGTTWTQQAKLIPTAGAMNDVFGASVDLNSDTALIASPGDDDFKGAVYVFARTGSSWTQQQKLVAPGGVSMDVFGYSVALNNNTALIGKPGYIYQPIIGAAYVFIKNGATWTQQAILTSSDGTPGDQFASCVDLDGDTALIGALYHFNDDGTGGAAYLYTRTGSSWTEQQKLMAADGSDADLFGNEVSLDGDIAFIGDYFDRINGYYAGSAYVFSKGSPVDLELTISGGIGVHLEIKNNGASSLDDVNWQLQVEGGFFSLIQKTVNGTIDLGPGQSETFSLLPLGFGAITITAQVAVITKTAQGTQLLIITMVKK
jgi:hypothetical protein